VQVTICGQWWRPLLAPMAAIRREVNITPVNLRWPRRADSGRSGERDLTAGFDAASRANVAIIGRICP